MNHSYHVTIDVAVAAIKQGVTWRRRVELETLLSAGDRGGVMAIRDPTRLDD